MTEVDVLEVVARDRLAFEDDGLAFDPSFAKRLEHSRPAGRNRTEVLLPE